jgi:hypothetical protein
MCIARFSSVTLRSAALLAVAFAVGAATQSVQAQRPSMTSEMTDLYGRGVHSFYAGRTQEADQQLSEVINSGATDPRVFYFRALARMQCGFDAESDLLMGARYEAQDPGAASEVGQALARIQGPQRQLLEKYRRQARIDRVQQVRRQSQDLYEQRQTREPDVLHSPRPIDLGDLPPAASGAVTPPSAAPEAAPRTPQPRLAPDAQPPATGSPFDEPPALDEFGGTQPPPSEDPSEQFGQEVLPEAEPAPFANPADAPPDAGPSATPDIGPDAPMEPPAIEDDGFGDPPGTPIESEAEAEADGDLPFGDDSAATDAAPAGEPTGAASSEPEKMTGILGRVIQRAVTPSNLPDVSELIPPMGPGGPMPGASAPEGAQTPPFAEPPADAPPAEGAFADEPQPFGDASPAEEPAPQEPSETPPAEAPGDAPSPFGEEPAPFGEPPAESPPTEEPPAEEAEAAPPADEPAEEDNPFEF